MATHKKTHQSGWFKSLFIAFIAAAFIRWLIVENFTIPSSSMESTLLTGDFIIVSKLHYGARLPRTPLQIPLTHQTIWGTRIPSYLPWIKFPYYRLPGFSKIKRGDIIVFNYPIEWDLPSDLREYYIKRCVGLPGDTISINTPEVTVNDEPLIEVPSAQFCHHVKTTTSLPETFFKQYQITEYAALQEGYVMHISSQKAEKIQKLDSIEAVTLITKPKQISEPYVYGNSEFSRWNEDHFGPLQVPEKGMTIAIDHENLVRYERVIKYYEGYKDVRVENDSLWINGQQVTQYTFKQNYYFMLGDNRHNSEDSRFWGFVPEDHIIGKAVLVLFSLDPTQGLFHYKKIRWNRLFRLA